MDIAKVGDSPFEKDKWLTLRSFPGLYDHMNDDPSMTFVCWISIEYCIFRLCERTIEINCKFDARKVKFLLHNRTLLYFLWN